MWDFTSGFLSPIGSLEFSQFLDSLIMNRPKVSRITADHRELVINMFQIRLSGYYIISRMNFRTLAMYFLVLELHMLGQISQLFNCTCISY